MQAQAETLLGTAIPRTHLGQGVPSEAGGLRESAGYPHGHQCQQPLRLMQNRISVWEASSVTQAWRPASPQLSCQLLPHTLCPQEEEDYKSEVGWGPLLGRPIFLSSCG